MSEWIDVGSGHVIQVLDNGGLVWEHDCTAGYSVARHMVGARRGATWKVIDSNSLTLSPSLHCDPKLGGCGVHGFIRKGQWVSV